MTHRVVLLVFSEQPVKYRNSPQRLCSHGSCRDPQPLQARVGSLCVPWDWHRTHTEFEKQIWPCALAQGWEQSGLRVSQDVPAGVPALERDGMAAEQPRGGHLVPTCASVLQPWMGQVWGRMP